MTASNPRIPLATDEVHVWIVDYAAINDARLLDAYRELLDDAERAQQGRFYFERDRRRYLVTRALVRTVLARYAAVEPNGWVFACNEYGRPEPANDEARAIGLTFNLSHTHSLIALAVARQRAIGIDVENARAREAAIGVADRYFAPAEVAALHALPAAEQQLRFFEYWTFKESYIKARGMGLSLPLDQFAFDLTTDGAVDVAIARQLGDDAARWELRQFRPGDDYLVALCIERQGRRAPRVVVRRTVPTVSEILEAPRWTRCTQRSDRPMRDVTAVPDQETIVGFTRELVAFMSGRSPHAVDADQTLESLGIDRARLAAVLGAVHTCFSVHVPATEIPSDVRTAGQLANVVGGFVHQALRAQIPLRRDRAAESRRMLFIGGAAVPEFERAAAKRGWHAAMFTYYDPSVAGGPRVGQTGAIDHLQGVDWAQPLDIVRRIVELYGRGEIDRVVPDDEFGLLPAAIATSQLGVPGPSLKAVRNTRDKVHMRQTLEAAGLGQLRYAVCGDLAEAQAFLERVGGPIILKPVSGTGSEGVSRVATADELTEAFNTAAAAAGFMGLLCEEYVDGPEVSLEGYSVDGEFVPVTMTDKLVDEHFLEIGHQQPSQQPKAVFDAAVDLAGRALRALGVENGVTHTEFRITPNGPVLIETHTRMAGGHLHVVTRLSTGVDLADTVVAFSLGEKVDARPAPQGEAAAIRYILGRPGKVRGAFVPPPEEGTGIRAVLGPQPGRVVSGRSASRERLGHVIATGPTPELAGKAAEEFIGRIRIEYFD